jgi:outer membrane lipoprotein-sorting protein
MRTVKGLLALIFLVATMNLYSQDAKEIVRKSMDAIEFEAMEMTATLNIHDNRGNTRVRQVVVAIKKFDDATKTLMRFISPPDVQGTSILIYDYEDKSDDMWIFLPSLRRVRRIVSTEKGSSFMGSEFSNADMSRPNLDNFTYKLIGSETIDGKDCWKIEAIAASRDIENENGYNKRISYIDKSNYLMLKSELFDSANRPLKVHTLSDYRKQSNGRYFAYSMKMENVRSNRRSEMRIDKFLLGSNLDENSFAVTNLEK